MNTGGVSCKRSWAGVNMFRKDPQKREILGKNPKPHRTGCLQETEKCSIWMDLEEHTKKRVRPWLHQFWNTV